MKTGTRPDLSLGLLLLLLAAASGAGYWGIASISRTTIRTLQWDAHISQHAGRARADALLLRRYEKDVFINVADRKAVDRYYRKWLDAKGDMEERIADLERYATLAADREIVGTLREGLARYAAGFDDVCGRIRDGRLGTGAACNAAIGPYKDETYKMESVAQGLARMAAARMDAAESLVVAKGRLTTAVLLVVSVLAIVHIARRKKAERALARSARACRTLCRCNEAIVRGDDEQRLAEDICRILAEEGGYRLARVVLGGCRGRDATGAAAWSGRDGAEVACPGFAGAGDGTGGGPAEAAIRTATPVVAADLRDDPILDGRVPDAIARGIGSALALPISCGGGRPTGAMILYSGRAGAFDAGEIELLTRLANDLGYGICAIRSFQAQNQLNAELSSSREALRELARDIQSAREDERTTIAREIHDELGQELTVMKMEVAWLEKRLPEGQGSLRAKARSVKSAIDAAIGTVRRISSDLRPGTLDHLGLAAAVAWQANRFGERTGITCAVAGADRALVLGKDRETALFRIFQEALTNVARHSGADRVDVQLSEDGGQLILTVADNGRGFREDCVAGRGSLGLIGMRERIRPFGGVVEIEGVGICGTRLTVRVPIAGTETAA